VDASTWYDIWQAVVAIYGMCGRFGKTGFANKLGKSPLQISFLDIWILTSLIGLANSLSITMVAQIRSTSTA